MGPSRAIRYAVLAALSVPVLLRAAPATGLALTVTYDQRDAGEYLYSCDGSVCDFGNGPYASTPLDGSVQHFATTSPPFSRTTHDSTLAPEGFTGTGSVQGSVVETPLSTYHLFGESNVVTDFSVGEASVWRLTGVLERSSDGPGTSLLVCRNGGACLAPDRMFQLEAGRGASVPFSVDLAFEPASYFLSIRTGSPFGSFAGSGSWQFSLLPVPEPGTALLVAAGCLALSRPRRRASA